MAYFPHNEIKSNWCMFGQESPKTLINKGIQRFQLGFNSCRPHQNEAIMQKKMHKCLIFLHNWINIQSKKP